MIDLIGVKKPGTFSELRARPRDWDLIRASPSRPATSKKCATKGRTVDFWGEDGPIDSDRRQRIEDEVVHKTVVLSNTPEQAVKTNVAKTKSGWQASTRIDLVDGRILQVKTAKSLDGSLGTTALVHEVRRVNGNLTEDHNPRTDFGRRMVSWNVRETEQQVREQHQLALGMVEQLLPLIAKHYGG